MTTSIRGEKYMINRKMKKIKSKTKTKHNDKKIKKPLDNYKTFYIYVFLALKKLMLRGIFTKKEASILNKSRDFYVSIYIHSHAFCSLTDRLTFFRWEKVKRINYKFLQKVSPLKQKISATCKLKTVFLYYKLIILRKTN